MLRYFGLVYYDYPNKESRITSEGRKFYEAVLVDDKETQWDIIAKSINDSIFGIGADKGKNTAIKTGDSPLEAPKLFVKAICDLQGITLKEFSFLICDIVKSKHSFEDACSKMSVLEEEQTNLEAAVKGYGKFKDPKIHAFLENIGFCYKDSEGKYQLVDYVFKKYKADFNKISVFNSEFALKKYSNPKKISILIEEKKAKGMDLDCTDTYKDEVLAESEYDFESAELNRQNNRKPEMRNTKKGRKYKINPKLGKTQQKFVDYKCEVDESHITFNTKGKNERFEHPFMESHHLLPMKAQVEYIYNIDRTSNLICLCPNCHSQIHYGTEDERRSVLFKLYAKRFSAFSSETSINMTAEELFEKYYK